CNDRARTRTHERPESSRHSIFAARDAKATTGPSSYNTCMTFHYRDAPSTTESALATLPDALAGWFRERFGEPTTIQGLAWPALAAGGHLLVSASTGTGKTLAALLPVLGELLSPFEPRSWSTSPLRVVYVAPLKALVNDAARNLQAHLDGLSEW